jgi:hypothetical protein
MGMAIALTAVLSSSEAHAKDCTPPTPACHLENGKQLLNSDPKRAADELLTSYKLDERTDTLELYATALQQDKQYALALETWQRVIVFRETELEAAKTASKKATGKKRTEAKNAATRAEKQMDLASESIVKLWANVGKVRIRIPASEQFVVTRGGVEVDVTRDVLVNAGRDELVFTRKGGSPQTVVVEVAAGGVSPPSPPSPRRPSSPST